MPHPVPGLASYHYFPTGTSPRFSENPCIPAALKWEIRDKLDQANVTERVYFPGLDGLSRWLKRHYSPKSTPGS